MAHDSTESNAVERNVADRDERERSTGSALRTWTVLALVLGSLVGIPLVVLAETEFGLLSALGLPRQLALGVLALVPGFTLGGLSLVAMTGWE